MSIGPKNEKEKEIFAIEGFLVDVQHNIQKLMNDQRVNQKELARRLGVSQARVSQIFSDSSNLTIRYVAKIFYALGDECYIGSRRLDELSAIRASSKKDAAKSPCESLVAAMYRSRQHELSSEKCHYEYDNSSGLDLATEECSLEQVGVEAAA